MNIDLSDKKILLTGASRGIGLGIAKQLVDSRATVIAHYNHTFHSIDALNETHPGKVIPLQIDLGKMEELVDKFEDVEEKVKRIDGLVLNAGIATESTLDQDIWQWLRDWHETISINLHAPAVLTKLMLEHFRKKGGGRMIFISSRAAFRGDTMEYLAYGASKAGMLNMMKSIARGMGKDNIQAFGIAPGFVQTDMAQKFIDKYGKDFVLDDNALKKLTQPEDIAPLVAFLLSGKADHATGATFDINAGSYVR